MSEATEQLVDSEKRMGRWPEGPAHPRKDDTVCESHACPLSPLVS